MPNRIIRETILTSDKVDSLDPPAEVFYRRLLSKVDDYGRYDARPSILRASLFPLRIDRVREADCTRWLAACEKAGLIALYQHDGKPYVEVKNTGWVARSPSKFPDPKAFANICAQAQTNARLVVDVGVVVDEVEQGASPSAPPPAEPAETPKNGTRLPADWTLPSDWADWAKGERPDLNPAEVAARFADHWHAKPGKDGRKLDWLPPWRNWVRGERAGPAKAPSAVPRGKPAGPSESPLEAALSHLRFLHSVGQIDASERDKRMAEATAKHRRAA